MGKILGLLRLLKRTVVIPAGIATLIFGGLFYLFLVAGYKGVKSDDGLVQFFGVFAILVSISLLGVLWKIIGELRQTDINNTWFFGVLGLSILLSGYSKYGPGGHYIDSALAATPVLVIKALNPSLYDSLTKEDS